jgi:hypothetical protein
MRVQLHTDRHIEAHYELAHQVETVMEGPVGHQAATLPQAIDGAAKKLAGALETTLGRLGSKKGCRAYGGNQTS